MPPALTLQAAAPDDAVALVVTASAGPDAAAVLDPRASAHLRAAGIPCLILSTERNPVVASRAKKIRIPVVQGISDKAQEVLNQCRAREIDPREVAYVGNDLNDLAAMQQVGMPWCPADAAPEVRRICALTLKARGGEGVVREIARRLGLKWKPQK